MNYKGIMERVSTNVHGNGVITERQKSVIKTDIFDVIVKLLRKTEGVKDSLIRNITSNKTELLMPEHFFSAFEILFKGSDGNKLYTKEVSYEKLMNWNPNITADVQSFSALVTDASPQGMLYSQEGEDLDGYLCYHLFDERDMPKLVWKPAITGTVEVFYSVVPDDEIRNLESTPDIHYAFNECIVMGASCKGIVRKMGDIQNGEVGLVGLQVQLKEYKSEYTSAYADYKAFTEKVVTTSIVEPFDFLNDRGMLL